MLNPYIKLYIQADENRIVIKFHNCKNVLDKLNYKQSNVIDNLIYLIPELSPYIYTIITENPYPSMDTPLNFS
jgi:hypothetical protein